MATRPVGRRFACFVFWSLIAFTSAAVTPAGSHAQKSEPKKKKKENEIGRKTAIRIGHIKRNRETKLPLQRSNFHATVRYTKKDHHIDWIDCIDWIERMIAVIALTDGDDGSD